MNAYSAGKHLYCSAIWSAGFILVLLTGCISDQKIPKVVVETEPLSTQDMVKYPAWQPTDPIPLSPDAAVVLGWKWILTNTKDCDAGSEPKVMDIRLCELSEGRWFYTVLYGVRLTGGGTRVMPVRVFLDGTVWNQKVTMGTGRPEGNSIESD